MNKNFIQRWLLCCKVYFKTMNYSKVSDLCSKLLAKTFKLTLKGKYLKRIITYLNNSNNCYKKNNIL